MTLDKVKRGQQFVICNIDNEETRTYAIRFGLSEGVIVTCQATVPAGPVVISRCKTQIAIGRKLAKNINVKLMQKKCCFE